MAILAIEFMNEVLDRSGKIERNGDVRLSRSFLIAVGAMMGHDYSEQLLSEAVMGADEEHRGQVTEEIRAIVEKLTTTP